MWLGVVALCALAAAPASAQERSAEFELQVGDNAIEVQLDKPFTITTPKGERVAAVLHRRETLSFSGAGIAFDYPAAMKASIDTTGREPTIVVECDSSPFVLMQLYPRSLGVKEVTSIITHAYKTEMGGRGATIDTTVVSVQRRVAGSMQTGQQIAVALAGEKLQIEVFVVPRRHDILALVLQYDIDENALAQDYFDTIAPSIH